MYKQHKGKNPALAGGVGGNHVNRVAPVAVQRVGESFKVVDETHTGWVRSQPTTNRGPRFITRGPVRVRFNQPGGALRSTLVSDVRFHGSEDRTQRKKPRVSGGYVRQTHGHLRPIMHANHRMKYPGPRESHGGPRHSG